MAIAAGACLATPALGQVEPDLGHRWRFSVGGGSSDQDSANAVTILRVGHDPNPPGQLAGTIVTVGDTKIGSGQQGAWVTLDNGAPDGSAGPISGQRGSASWGGSSTGQASAQDVAAASIWHRTTRHGYVTGWFDQEVNFGGSITKEADVGGSRDAYLAFFKQSGSSAVPEWVAKMSGAGRIEGLSVAVSEKCNYVQDSASPPAIPAAEARRYECKVGLNMVAVAGFFTASSGTDIEFFDQDDGQFWQPWAHYEAESNGGEDAFIAIYVEGDPQGSCQGCFGGEFRYRLTFGGEGDERVNAITFDPVDQSIIVTGFFSDEVDFNPEGDPHVKTSEGGKDIFDDYLDFLDAHGNPSHADHARTDWNFSGGTPDQTDIDLFVVAWLLGCCQ